MAVTKEQLAQILLKAKYGSLHYPLPATGSVFTDVGVNTFAADWIEDLANKGITEGCDANNFCPKEAITVKGFEFMLNKALP